MKRKRFVLIALALLVPLPALATLGGDATSVTSDQSHLRAQRRATLSNGYTVHELQTDSGIVVREFVAASGKVFAVAWRGPNMPDLPQLLGTYFPQFSAAMTERRKNHVRGPVLLQQNDLIVESNGHMRAYFGRAYIPSLLPPQVTPAEIQ